MKTNYIGRFSLLLVATLAAIIPAKADYDAWQEGVYYLFLEDQKARVVAADTKYKGDVTVTETFEQEGVTYTVTEVGDGAFYQCPNLTSVTLPATITAIGVNAFRESANLTAVNLPEGLVSIGNNAFHSCSSLASITLPASLLSIGEYAFYNCSALTSDIVLGANLQFVGNSAFQSVGISSVTFARGALDDSDEYEVAYDDWVSTNHDDGSTSESTIQLNGIHAGDIFTFDSNISSANGDYLRFKMNDDNFKSYQGESGGYNIYTFNSDGDYTFTMSYEKNGDGTGGFDDAAVRNIHLFTNPAKYLTMGENVFRDCGNLATVDIQRRKVHSGNYMFYNTPRLTDVTINADRPYNPWFTGHTAIQRLTLGNKVHSLAYECYAGCTSLREVNFDDAIGFIGARVFYNCPSLTTVKLPAALTRINAETFRGCTKLGSIQVPASVQGIGDYAFYDCYALKSFQVPEGITTLNPGTFRYNHALNSIVLPSTLESIGQYALDNCENLTTLVIPEKVTDIHAEAFTNCGLSTFYAYNPTPITFGDANPFSTYFAKEDTELTLYVPADALAAYKGKKIWQQFNDAENGRHLLPIDVVPCAQPTFYYDNNYHLTISTTTPSEEENPVLIYYTTDGTDPVVPEFVDEEPEEEEIVDPETEVKRRVLIRRRTNGETELTTTFVYEGPVAFDHNMTVKAVAAKKGMATSPVASFTKTDFKVSTPTARIVVEPATEGSPATEETEAVPPTPQKFFMELSAEQPEGVSAPARIYYNVQDNPTYASWGWWPSEYNNEADVLANCTLYEGKYELTQPGRMRIYAIRDDWNMSNRYDFDYYSAYRQDAPTYKWDGENKKFTLTHADAEVEIWYTLDGSDPADMTNAKRYQYDRSGDGVTVSNNLTVRAVAIKPGRFNAEMGQQTINNVTTAFMNEGIAYRHVDNTTEDVVEVTSKDGGYSGDITIPETITQAEVEYTVVRIGNNAFSSNGNLTSVNMPASVTSIGSGAFYNCDALNAVSISANTTAIGYRAFYDCDALTTIDIPASVTSIGQEAFAYSDRLETITLNEGLTTIGDHAFRNTPVLALTLPGTLRTMGQDIFYECRSLNSLTISDGVTALGVETFRRCSALTEVTIPSSVTRLEAHVFDECTALRTVNLPNTLTYIGDWCFSSCPSLTEWLLPASITELGPGALAYSSGLKSVVFPEQLKVLPESILRDDTGLTSVTLPSGLTTIGNIAFYNCSSLQSIDFPATVTTIGSRIFQACGAMKTLNVQMTTPPAIPSDALSHIAATALLLVPEGTKSKYEAADYWKAFANMQEGTGPLCAQPVITFSEADYKLTITSLTEDAVIHYTTDESDPTADSPVYDSETRVDFNHNMTVKAIATKEGMTNSTIATYTRSDFKVATPTVDINTETMMVTLDAAKPATNVANAEIYYILSVNTNNWPTDYQWNDTESIKQNCTLYEGPFRLERPGMIRVYAIREGWINADQYYRNLYNEYFLAAPSVTHDAETKTVTITKQNGDELNPQVTVYYTLDGTDPNVSETRVAYSEPFTVTHNVVVKAIATMAGRCNSDVTTYNRISDINSTFAEGGIYYRLVDNASTNIVEVTSWQADESYAGAITIPAKVTHDDVEYDVVRIGDNAFYNDNYNNAVTDITLPASITSIGINAFRNNDALTTITLPADITTIGDAAFYDCDGLISVALPTHLTGISAELFRYCDKLENVTIPAEVQRIENYAFFSCPKLKEITIPTGVTAIPYACFDDDYALVSVTLPNTITRIEDNAFNTCTSLQSIILPSTLERLGYRSFSECTSLTHVYCNATTPPALATTSSWSGDFTFYQIGENPTLHVPEEAVDTYKGTDGWNFFGEENIIKMDGVPCAQPTFAFSGYNLSMATTTDGATIYYTTDGSDPATSETSVAYENPIPYLYLHTVRAVAKKEGMDNSPIGTYLHATDATFKVATPSVNVNTETMTVTIEVEKPDTRIADAEIFYSLSVNSEYYATDIAWDNTEAIRGLTPYNNEGFVLDKPGMIRIYALRPGWTNADRKDENLYTEYFLAIPEFAWNSETRTMTINQTEEDVNIYYTFDSETNLTAESDNRHTYAEPLTLTRNNTLRAIAMKAGKCNSEIGSISVTDVTYPFQVGNLWYRMTDNTTDPNAYLIAPQGEDAAYTGAVTIPATITVNSSPDIAGTTVNVNRMTSASFANQTGVTSVNIAAPFTEIPNNAFQGCTALTTVTIPATVTFIGNYAFDGCSALTQAIHLGENVATIGAYAFRNTRLAGLTIDNVPPATVEVPAQHLESWTSPATGHNSSNENTWEFNAPEGASLSFNWAVSSEANCDWFRVYLDGNLLVERSGQITGVYNEPISAGNHTLLARYSKDGSAVGGTDNGTISDITIGAGLHGLLTVGEYAFNNAPMLAVDIQRENVSIPVNAFEGCNALTEVKLNTASVSSWFAGRSELRTVNLGSAVTTIADQAFQNCNKLGSVFSYNTTPPTIGANTFNGIPADAVLYVTEGSEEAYSADTEDNYWKQFTTIQGIADGIVPCALPQFAYNAYNLTITSATAGAAIYYTTDGSVPTTSSSQYSAALPILFNQTVRAIAVKEGYANSPVAEWSTTSSTEISARYKVAAPTSNITETGENTFSVTFVVSKPDERIADHQLYYTTAEYQESLNKWTSELTVDEIRQVCTLYDGSYILNRPAVVHAIALRDGWIPSDWQAFDYSRGYSPSEPDVTYYSLAQPVVEYNPEEAQVTITYPYPEQAVTLYYTIDNSDPTTSETRIQYEEPIEVTRNINIRTVAVMAGHFTSEVRDCPITDRNDTFPLPGSVLYVRLIDNILTDEYEVVRSLNNESKYEGNIVVPATFQDGETTCTITRIADDAFNDNDKLLSITLPETIKSIGNRAFRSCQQLKNINIPASVETIGTEAFTECPSLEQITLHEGLTTIGYRAFWDDNALTSVTFPNSLTTLAEGCFDNCDNLSEVTFGEGITFIGKLAFWSAAITDVELPEGVTYLGEQAFESCSKLQHIKLPSTLTKLEAYTFRNCSNLMYVELPETLTEIGVEAFQSCTSLMDITLPGSLQTLRGSSFRYCSALRSVVIPEGITVIHDATFQQCSSLVNLTLPSTLTTIQEYAFDGCSTLKSVILPENVTSIGTYAFTGCTSLTDLYALPLSAPVLEGDENSFAFRNLNEQIELHTRSIAKLYTREPLWRLFTNTSTFTNPPAAQPTFIFDDYQLALATTTENARIFYTVDGTTPVPFTVEEPEEPEDPETPEDSEEVENDEDTENSVSEVKRRTEGDADGGDGESTETEPQGETFLYEGPIQFIANGTVKAVAVAEGFDASPVGEFTVSNFKVTQPEIAISDDLRMTITSEKPSTRVEDAQIYYTLNEWSNNIHYSYFTEEQIREYCTLFDGTYQLHTPGTVFTIALRDGWIASEWNNRSYSPNETWQKLSTPEISVNQITITLSTTDEVEAIYYTLDGSTPTRESTRYTAPFQIPKSDGSSSYTEIRAYAVKAGKFDSDVAYTRYRQSDWTCSTPTFSGSTSQLRYYRDGSYKTDSLVYISCSTEDAIIYYTLDGTDPTRKSTRYTEPIKVEHNMTIKAIAVKENFIDSNVGTQEITWVQLHTPTISIPTAYCTITQDIPGSTIYYKVVDGEEKDNEQIAWTLYEGPFQMEYKETIVTVWAYAVMENYNNSDKAYITYSASVDKRCDKPLVVRITGTNQVRLSTETEDAKIFYTIDGTTPTTKSTEYLNEPITLDHNCTIRAIAVNFSSFNSLEGTLAVDWFKVARPTFADDGIYLAISTTTEDASIYYTTDNSVPTNESTLYTEPINMRTLGDKTVKAIGIKHNFNDSDIQSFEYTIAAHSAGTPAFTPDTKANKVSIVSALPQTVKDAPETVIYYTLDGSTPTAESTVYTGPIDVVENGTIKAYAVNDKLFASAVASFDVTWFTVAKPEFAYDEKTHVLIITCDTVNSAIHYAYEDQPTKFLNYDGPITLINNRTVTAYATRTNFNESARGSYTPKNFTCDNVTFAYNGRYVTMAANEGATIHYTLDNSTPTATDEAYSDKVEITQLCRVKAIAMKPYFNNSTLQTYEVTYLFNGEDVDMSEAGHLEEVFAWKDGGATGVTTLPVKGKVNADDIAFIKTMTDLEHLDMSAATIEGNKIPDNAFAGTNIVSYISPTTTNLTAGDHVFENCPQLAAVVWNVPSVPSTGIWQDVAKENPNFLLYVTSSENAPKGYTGNVVKGTAADKIVLTDDLTEEGGNYNFYCPKRFLATTVTYTHHYATKTGKTDDSKSVGWETITLPFNVEDITLKKQKVTNDENVKLAPFAAGKDVEQYRPFWLYQFDEDEAKGLEPAAGIKAYTPYIVSMPNNDRYADRFNIEGDVTFTASDVYIDEDQVNQKEFNTYHFVPTVRKVEKSNAVYAINREATTIDDYDYEVGSIFIAGQRDIRPFEAYTTHSGTAASRIMRLSDLMDNEISAIRDVEMNQLLNLGIRRGVYDLQGRKIADDESYFEFHPNVKGVYIINGEKRLIK